MPPGAGGGIPRRLVRFGSDRTIRSGRGWRPLGGAGNGLPAEEAGSIPARSGYLVRSVTATEKQCEDSPSCADPERESPP